MRNHPRSDTQLQELTRLAEADGLLDAQALAAEHGIDLSQRSRHGYTLLSRPQRWTLDIYPEHQMLRYRDGWRGEWIHMRAGTKWTLMDAVQAAIAANGGRR